MNLIKKTILAASVGLASFAVATPALADTAVVDEGSGLITFSGMARLDLSPTNNRSQDCRTAYNRDTYEYEIWGCDGIKIDRTTEPNLKIRVVAPWLNRALDILKSQEGVTNPCDIDGIECDRRRVVQNDLRDGSFGVEFLFDSSTLMRQLVTFGNDETIYGATRDCVYTAIPVDINRSANELGEAEKNIAGMSAVVVQNRKNPSFAVYLFNADGSPASLLPEELAVTWQCAVPAAAP